ncbi:probable metal-nicotianamine transporter YSL7 [Miscanthus floridulus]|uniref:probable metal-nicotianamine transporter YSL7 n=1 Tax=Miscanthus floridulus TaxID=154761 RepID=UPI003457D61D
MEQVDCVQEGVSTERAFEADPIPSLLETITPRSIVVSFILGVALCAVAMKISLSSGFLPSLTVPAGLIGFYLIRAWFRALDCFELPYQPFTRQENTVIQTCVVACSAITFSGGFGTYILAMGKNAAGGDTRDEKNIIEPSIGRLIAFLFLVSFSGLFILMPFRKVMIIRHRLTFPSGMATAHLINSFHTPQGVNKARQQVKMLFSSFGGSVLWNIFQWFFTAAKDCGFKVFPIFGLEAYKHGFYFDFSMSNIGIGMLCPYIITVSMFIGCVISWGIISPYLATKAGIWYPSNISSSSLNGIRGYKVFIGVSMILADGLFNFLSIVLCTLYSMCQRRKQPMQGDNEVDSDTQLPFHCLDATEQQKTKKSFGDRRRAHVFLRDHISNSVNIICYILLSVVSTIAIPYLYPQMKHIHVALIYLVAPVIAFCDAYAFGVTDMNLSSTYGKLAMVLIGSSVGRNDGGVIAGLVSCGIVMGAMSNSNNLMQDLKTGYLTLTSPHVVFISQAIGTAFGCIINPVMFWIFYKVQNGDVDIFDAPYARVYRSIAMLSAGQNALPMHSLWLCKLFFALALVLSMFRELATWKQWRVAQYIPSTICVAIAIVVPARIPIDMFVGSLVLYLWRWANPSKAPAFSMAVASGMVCGDGLGMLLSSTMALTQVRAPLCIKFLSRTDNVKLDTFLATLPMT